MDRISNLPDGVLCRILSHLQTKEVVATSILSKRWELVWSSILNLDISDQLQCCKDYETEIRTFKDYVDSVLFHHGGSVIEKCHLSCESQYASTYMYTWICAIVCCSVQELSIQSFRLESRVSDLPWSLFICKTLVVLKIKGGFVLNLPSCFCLPSLKALHLESVIYVDDASAEKLFSGCPCLEELDIKRNDWDGVQNLSISIPSLKILSICFSGFYIVGGDRHETKISTPNLEYFRLWDGTSKYYFVNTSPSLIEACIDCKYVDQILQGLQNVRLLALSGHSGGTIRSLHDIDLPKFKHLSRLQLSVSAYVDWSSLLRLLENAPNLEVLVFPEGLLVSKKGEELRGFYWHSPENVPECFVFHLKIVEIQKFVGVPCEMRPVKFLLESCKVLERMTIHCDHVGRKRRKMNMGFVQNQILNAPRGSEACKVEIIE